MRNTFVDVIIEAAKTREDIFIISGDAGLGVFDTFKNDQLGKFLNLGIAEQNAISFAAGLSLTGYKPYIYNIAPFVLYRCYEQVRNDICYQRLPVVLIGIGSGLTYAPAGMTHYSVEDIGLAQTLPNLNVFSPIDPVEAKMIATYSLSCNDPIYVRIPKRGEPKINENDDFDITKPRLIKNGERTAIVFHGSVSIEVLAAVKILEKQGINPKLISAPMIQPFNYDAFSLLVNDVQSVIVVEEHYVGCGLGSILAKEYVKRMPKWKLYLKGIPDKFVHEIKDIDGMRDHFGISAKKIAEFTGSIYGK
jgi:transketolase